MIAVMADVNTRGMSAKVVFFERLKVQLMFVLLLLLFLLSQNRHKSRLTC